MRARLRALRGVGRALGLMALGVLALTGCETKGGLLLPPNDDETPADNGNVIDFGIRRDILQIQQVQTMLAVTGVDQATFEGVAFTVSNRSTLGFAAGDGSGPLAEPVEVALGAQPGALAQADFDGDGRMDIAVACMPQAVHAAAQREGSRPSLAAGTAAAAPLEPHVALVLQVAPGRFELAPERYPLPAAATALAPLRDAHATLLLVTVETEHATLLLAPGPAPGRWSEQERFMSAGLPTDAVAVDFDTDGSPDVVIAEQGASSAEPDQVHVHRRAPGGAPESFLLATHLAAPALATTLDLDGDGACDLLVHERAGNRALLFASNDPHAPLRDWTLPGPLRHVAIADVDGGGQPDVIFSSGNDAHLGVALALAPLPPSSPLENRLTVGASSPFELHGLELPSPPATLQLLPTPGTSALPLLWHDASGFTFATLTASTLP